MNYRKELDSFEINNDEIKINISYIELEDANKVINSIESRLNLISNLLEDITGLVEVDRIKEDIQDLIRDLY